MRTGGAEPPVAVAQERLVPLYRLGQAFHDLGPEHDGHDAEDERPARAEHVQGGVLHVGEARGDRGFRGSVEHGSGMRLSGNKHASGNHHGAGGQSLEGLQFLLHFFPLFTGAGR